MSHRCVIRFCPYCYQAWARKEGRIAAWILWADARKMARENGLCHYRLLHCVVSLVDDGRSLRTLTDEAYRIAKAHGLSGGCKVFHPFRQVGDDGDFVPDGYVHFHVVGVAFGDIRFASKGQDYVFKVIPNKPGLGKRPFSGIPSVHRLARPIAYLLTHCGVQDRRHAITWWGCLKDRRVAKKVLIADFAEGWLALTKRRNPKCPECGSRDTMSCDYVFWSKAAAVDHNAWYGEGALSRAEYERLEGLRGNRGGFCRRANAVVNGGDYG